MVLFIGFALIVFEITAVEVGDFVKSGNSGAGPWVLYSLPP